MFHGYMIAIMQTLSSACVAAQDCKYTAEVRPVFHIVFSQCFVEILILTSSSAIAEGPRDALSHLKSCQLLHNCTKNHI